MELTARLMRWGARRPHLLLVEVPGAAGVRLAVERHARGLGWPLAPGPSDADVLVVCGAAEGALAEAVTTTWQAMPGPRARLELVDTHADAVDVGARLERAVADLADPDAQRADADARPVAVADDPTPEAEAEAEAEQHGQDSETEDSTGDEDGGGGMDHGDMEMDMDMSLPGGLIMADRAEDRDGLKLDVLHLQLGPFLPSWPAGLALDVVLQGDVVQQAEVRTFTPPGATSRWLGPPAVTAAAHLDSAGRLLTLAGWSAAAEQAARLRDDALLAGATPDLAGGVRRLRTRAERSWSLRWGLRDLGVLRAADARRHGVSGPALRADGDVLARLLQWLLEAEQALLGEQRAGEGPRGSVVDGRPPSAALLDVLPGLVTGLDLAGARLVVASLDPDVAELAATPARAYG